MIFICPLDICAYKLKILNSFFDSITYIKKYKTHIHFHYIFSFFFSFLFLLHPQYKIQFLNKLNKNYNNITITYLKNYKNSP